MSGYSDVYELGQRGIVGKMKKGVKCLKKKICNFFNWDCNRDECNSNTVKDGYRYDPCDPNPPCPPCVPTKNGYYKCPPCPKSNCFTLPECEKDRYQPTGKY